jgi:hypothetical protein
MDTPLTYSTETDIFLVSMIVLLVSGLFLHRAVRKPRTRPTDYEIIEEEISAHLLEEDPWLPEAEAMRSSLPGMEAVPLLQGVNRVKNSNDLGPGCDQPAWNKTTLRVVNDEPIEDHMKAYRDYQVNLPPVINVSARS